MADVLNKLVRDNIIDYIERSQDKGCTYSYLAEEDFPRELKAKLHEEVEEFLEDNAVEELADILEVVFALAKLQQVSEEELLRIRKEKREERGGFDKRLFLHEMTYLSDLDNQ